MKQRSYTDQDIITAVLAGGSECERVMAYLYGRYVNQIIAFVRERSGTEEEAKDIYQDAIVNLLLAIQDGRFEGRSAVSTYLFAIALGRSLGIVCLSDGRGVYFPSSCHYPGSTFAFLGPLH